MSETSQLTLMAVHAHPDDEASTTGGILARYSSEGIRTVLVTCTNGELGDGPNGAKPGEPGHDEEAVVAERRAELEASCAVLGLSDLELLGFRDSGMAGWDANHDRRAFAALPVEQAARPLVSLLERYRPQVLVTYDANGFYGHPDHIQAHRITMAAAEACPVADKIYFPAVPRSFLPQFALALREGGVEVPGDIEESGFGTDDDLIAAVVDCSAFVGQKLAALKAHRSQTESTFFLQLKEETFKSVFGREFYVRAFDRTEVRVPEDDLFAGLR